MALFSPISAWRYGVRLAPNGFLPEVSECQCLPGFFGNSSHAQAPYSCCWLVLSADGFFLILMVKFFSINGKTSMFHGLAWLNHTLSVYLCDGWTSNFNKNMSQFVLWSNLQSSKVSCVLLPPLLATDLGTLGNHGKRGWVKLETGLRRIWDVWWMVLVALCFSHDS